MNARTHSGLFLRADTRREGVAWLASACSMALLFALRHLDPLPLTHEPATPMLVRLEAAPVLEPLPVVPRATPQMPARPQSAPARPVTTAPDADTAPARPSTAAPAMAAAVATTAAAAAGTVAAAKMAEPPLAAARSTANADHVFEARIRGLIEQQKTYPSNRQAAIEKPEGTVHACVELGRDGSVRAVSIQDSAGSALLDQAARRLLSSIGYPAFPESSYAGASAHVFCTRLKYEPPSN